MGLFDKNAERLPVLRAGHAHGAQFLGQRDLGCPLLEGVLDLLVQRALIGEQLQARPGADCVIGQSQDDASRIGVVGDLVARAVAQRAPHVRRCGGIGRQGVGIRPVAAVVRRRSGGIEAPAHVADGNGTQATARIEAAQMNRFLVRRRRDHQSAPGGTILETRTPRPEALLACLELR